MKRHGLMLEWQMLLLAGWLFSTVPGARAATNTWTGADPSGYWSAPANWSPAGVPVNGNDLVFPNGLPPGDRVSTNDLTDGFLRSIRFDQGGRHTIHGNPITLTNRAECIINRGTNVIACDLTFSGTPITPTFQFPSIRGFAGGTPTELTLSGNVGGGGLYVFGERLVIRGQFTGGSLRQQYGALALYGDYPHAVSVEILGSSHSTLRVQGSQPNLNITMLWEMESASCPSLSGDGVVGDVTGCGHIDPDSTLSVKNLGHFGGWGGLDVRLNGTNVGEYGRLISSGDVSLSSGRLLPSAGFTPQAGQVFTIVEKTSPGPIANAFLGSEGTVTTLNGMPFRISYVGGDGNDVTLTAQSTTTPTTTNTWTGADPSGYWSAPANWSPAGVPVNGSDLVFPGGLPPEDMVSTNDLIDSVFRSITFGQASRHTLRGNPITLTNRASAVILSGTNVIACDLAFTGTPSTPTAQYPTIRGSGFPGGELTVNGNVGGGSLYVSSGMRLVVRGQFTGSRLRLFAANLALLGDNPHAVSLETQVSKILVQGSQPSLNIAMLSEMESGQGSSLSGDGLVGNVSGVGSITLDSTLSAKNIVLIFSLEIQLNGTNAGEYGRLVASGDVTLYGGRLLPSAGFTPQAGQVFTIVEKTSPGPISNAFLGPEGTVTTLNGMPFRISYVGGDGNDVTLTVIAPVPVVLGAVQRSGTQFVFSYSADVGLRYAVERSATWSNWTTIWSNTATVNPMTVTDFATNGMNFYRVRRLSNP